MPWAPCTSELVLSFRLANGSTYVVPVGIGSPSRAYPLQLDTASADLLIASTKCGKECPAPTKENPYYDMMSSDFKEVNGNSTYWRTQYADKSFASGFVARDQVMIAAHLVDDQVIGLITATNMSLPEQDISGVLGLGFPRLSTLGRVLLQDSVPSSDRSPLTSSAAPAGASSPSGAASAPSESGASGSAVASPSSGMERRQESSSDSSGTASATSSSAPAAAVPSSSAAYMPTLLENLITTPSIPYPAFALALSPPLNASQATALKSLHPEPAPRYSLSSGSLTLGGVSALYVSDDPSTGRTVNDIEWWPVVPFGRASNGVSRSNATTIDVSAMSASATPAAAGEPASASGSGASAPSSPSASSSSSSAPGSNLLQDNGMGAIGTPGKRGLPKTPAELESEAYLYWALQLSKVSVNGTGFALNSTYANLGVPPIALLDVGTNGIYGPEDDVAKLFSGIKDARMVSTGQWAVPCDTRVTLGFSFGENGGSVEIPPSDWIYAAVPESSMCLAWPVAVPATGDGLDWQLGTPFLKNVYTVFSYGVDGGQPPQIGFLPLTDKANGTQPVSAATPSQTVNTKLPHVLLSPPNYPTPSYAFSTPVPTLGVPQALGLGNASAYPSAAVPVVSIPVPKASASDDHQAIPGWPGDSSQATVENVATKRQALPATSFALPFILIVLSHLLLF